MGEGSPSKIDYRKKGTLILTSLLEDLVSIPSIIWQNSMIPEALDPARADLSPGGPDLIATGASAHPVPTKGRDGGPFGSLLQQQG